MVTDKSNENYLIKIIGLTEEQIKNMLPSEVDKYCENVIQERIKNRGIYNPDLKSEKN